MIRRNQGGMYFVAGRAWKYRKEKKNDALAPFSIGFHVESDGVAQY